MKAVRGIQWSCMLLLRLLVSRIHYSCWVSVYQYYNCCVPVLNLHLLLVSGAPVGFFVGFVTAGAFSLRPSSRFSSSSSSSSSVSQSLLLFFDDKSEDEGGAVSSLLSGKATIKTMNLVYSSIFKVYLSPRER